MTSVTKPWDRLTDEQRRTAIDQIIHFFDQERDEQIGVIAAEKLLNFFLENIGSDLYSKGVNDAKGALEKRLEDLNYDLDDLQNT